MNKTTWKLACMAALMWGQLLLVGCGGDDDGKKASEPPVDQECEGVMCQAGVCEAGECVNAADCQGQDASCVAGYLCNASSNTCVPRFACSSSQPCERGSCNAEGACVNAESCTNFGQCLPGFACGGEAKCIVDRCQDEGNTCARGVCRVGSGECVNAEECTPGNEEAVCLEGFRCIGGGCEDEAGFCQQVDCASSGGVCNFASLGPADRCVNAQPGACGGDDANCLKGFFCDSADNTCKPDQCEVDGCLEDGGVCDKASGSCVNPTTCASASECLNDHFCVAQGGQNVCVPRAQACAQANCTGLQLCQSEEATFGVSCSEPDVCQDARDCLEARVCSSELVCAEAGACVPDANEPNEDSAQATDYFGARQGALVRGSLCAQDVDVWAFDTTQDVEETGRLVVDLQLATRRLIGQGQIKAELSYRGNVVQSGTTVDGRLRLEQPVTLAFVGLYELRLAPEAGEFSTQGLDYQVRMDLLDNAVVQACMNPKVLSEGVATTSSTLSGASTAIAASCGDPQGQAFEDIYTITLVQKSFLSVFVDSGDMANVGVSLRRECLSNESEVAGACADREGLGGIERIEALLDPGTYFVVVQGADETLGGSYEITWTRRDVTCTASDSRCVSATSSEICRADGQGFSVQACDEGCNQARGACNALKGEVCGTAQLVDENTPLQGYVVQWSKLKNDYNVNVAGCVPATGGLVNATSGPDQAFRVQLPPNHVLVASVTQESNAVGAKTDASLYVVEDCLNTDGSCQVGVNGGDGNGFGREESLYISNEDPALARTLLVVVDTANAGSYVNSVLNIQVLPKVCEPAGFECAVDPGTMKAATRECNENGTALDAPVECADSDFCSATNNCGNDDVCLGAPLVVSGFRAEPKLGTGYTDTVDISCAGLSTPSGAEEAFYAVEVPDGSVLRVTATSSSTFDDPVLAIFDDCADLNNTCLAGVSAESAAEVFWRNDTGASKTVFVAFSVTDAFVSSTTDFSIEFDVRAPECAVPGEVICDGNDLKTCNASFVYDVYPCDGTCGTVTPKQCDNPTGDVCFDTIKLTGTSGSISGTYENATNASELADGVNGGCEVPDADETDGPDRIFEVTLKDKEMIEARLAGDSSSVLYMSTTCGDPTASCLANQTDVGSGSVVRHLNTTGADQTIFLTADYLFNTTTSFVLNYTITPGLTCVPRGRSCDVAGTGIEVCQADGTAVRTTLACPTGSMCERGRCQAEAAANVCATAPTVASQYSVVADTTSLTSDQNLGSSSCAGGTTPGPDAFHQILVPAGNKLIVETISVGADTHSIYIFDSCATLSTSCLQGVRVSFSEDYNGRLEWINTQGADKTVIVGVDMAFTSANDVFGISFETVAPECTTAGAVSCEGDRLRTCGPNLFYDYYNCSGTCGTVTPGRCDTPSGDECIDVALLPGPSGTVQGTYAGATNQAELPAGLSGACQVIEGDETDGPDRFYEVVLASGEMLRAILSTPTTTTSSALYLTTTCGDAANSCVANDSNPGDGATVEYLNTTGASQSVFLTVDYLFTSSSSYSLDYEIVTGLSCVPNSFKCAAAGTGVDRCRLDGSGYEPTVACLSGETCQNGACSPTNPAVNPSSICTTAPLVPAGYIALKDFRFAPSNQNPGSSSCTGGTTTGPDVFHRIEVPFQKRLKVETVAYGADTHSVYVFENCAAIAASCLAGQRVSSSPEDFHGDLTWYNNDNATISKTVTVAVDASSTSGDGFYGMRFEVLDPECVVGSASTCAMDAVQACSTKAEVETYACDTSTGGTCGTLVAGRCDNPGGDVCLDPFRVDVPAMLPATVSFTGDFTEFTATQNNITSGATSCTGAGANGRDAIYEVVLPPGIRVNATLDSPVATRNVSLYFLDTCGGGDSACLGGSDTSSLPERASYTNISTVSAKTIYVVVDMASSFTSSGDFKLDLEFVRSP